ncbi:MAG: cyclase family protein, partial [Chloroflexota bacterium]
DAVNVVHIALSPHTATHIDAYYHYEADGVHPPEMPIDAYIGPAHVVTVDKADGPLTPEDFSSLAEIDKVERLLVHSPVSDYPTTEFAHPYPYVSHEFIRWLAEEKGTRLIGLDSPSMDDMNSKDLPGHHALYQYNMVNIELLLLRDVPDGVYELVALPLKIDGVCGTPIRAILRDL